MAEFFGNVGGSLVEFGIGQADLALVGDGEVDDGEEGLAWFAVDPVGLWAGFIPGGGGVPESCSLSFCVLVQ